MDWSPIHSKKQGNKKSSAQFEPPPPPALCFTKGGLTSSNLAIRREWGRGLFRNGDSLLWHKFFIKKTKIFTILSGFFIILKISFVKYKISAPFSLTEAKMHIFNIHLVKLLIYINYKISFHISFFLNNTLVLVLTFWYWVFKGLEETEI